MSGTSEERSSGHPSETQYLPTRPFWFHFWSGIEYGAGDTWVSQTRLAKSPSVLQMEANLPQSSQRGCAWPGRSFPEGNKNISPPPHPGHCKAGKPLAKPDKDIPGSLGHSLNSSPGPDDNRQELWGLWAREI